MKFSRLWRWRPSRIGPRLFAFNLLVMFVPVAGVLYLDIYEHRLLEAQEREMVQQARLLSAVLGEQPDIDSRVLQRTFARLEQRTDARLRVFDATGVLLADSATVAAPSAPGEGVPEYAVSSGARERALYRLAAWFVTARERVTSVAQRWLGRKQPSAAAEGTSTRVAIKDALAGRYGAGTSRTPGQRSLTLVSAVPVRYERRVTGAVVISQSTFRILQTLYQIRLRVFEIVLLSAAAAAVLTTIAAATIVRPLKQLRSRASALAERRSPLAGTFPGTHRRDEIGALARSLDVLTRRLTDHITRLELFAADVAHEFRNPLASIRTAAETIAEATDGAERQRFVLLLRKDVDRLDRLVSGVRDMARIDGQLEHEALETVPLVGVLQDVVERVRLSVPTSASITMRTGDEVLVKGRRERLEQAFENVLANAASLAPASSAIDVVVQPGGGDVTISIQDRGPGIPDTHLARIFDRFFSYRPGEGRRDHVGLGLAIARQIVESYGGTIAARNRAGGGAVFDILLRRTADVRASGAATAERNA